MSNKAPNFKIPSTNSKLLELKKVKSKFKVLYFESFKGVKINAKKKPPNIAVIDTAIVIRVA